ncbi:uncharacterized protein LOC102699349 [Oryza brachyantha]|uniref:Protein kinase domain-containing protein n=1 Tax=Oryza brachyantha TaxID=4533 RepID=J3N8N5_ORYBR|nr:uncharacterized protein LOC102699349 [Oryza brachyantha]XP_015697799.1 uncharacterized protein LOC102699349 [Oryza brachyantha]
METGKNKEVASNAKAVLAHIARDDPPVGKIEIEQTSCELVVDESKIEGTALHHATCSTGHCVAISKPIEEAKIIYRILCRCNHPNLLKPIGVWKNPKDSTSAYLVLEKVEASLISKGREFMFSIEDSFIFGFSNIGFKIFRAICDVVNYINGLYMNSDVGTSSVAGAIPLMSVKLSSSMIFYKLTVEGEVEVVVADFSLRHPQDLVKKTRKGRPKEVTIGDVQRFNWRGVGLYLKKLYGDEKNVNEELKDLAAFLETGPKPEEGQVTYDEILWHPGVWESIIKINFIREIFWLIDKDRDRLKTKKFIETEKGKALSKIKCTLGIAAGLKMFAGKELKENNLLDSLIHLRTYIAAHSDDSYNTYMGEKDKLECSKFNCERLLQKEKGDYMIKLRKEIRSLEWITESPVLRDKNDYMAMFYEMKRKEMGN